LPAAVLKSHLAPADIFSGHSIKRNAFKGRGACSFELIRAAHGQSHSSSVCCCYFSLFGSVFSDNNLVPLGQHHVSERREQRKLLCVCAWERCKHPIPILSCVQASTIFWNFTPFIWAMKLQYFIALARGCPREKMSFRREEMRLQLVNYSNGIICKSPWCNICVCVSFIHQDIAVKSLMLCLLAGKFKMGKSRIWILDCVCQSWICITSEKISFSCVSALFWLCKWLQFWIVFWSINIYY